MGLVAAIGEAAPAGEPLRPEVLFAQAVGVPVARVLKATELEVDRVTWGVFGRYASDGAEIAAVVRAPGGQVVRLGAAEEAWFAGLVDLRAEGTLTAGRRYPRRLSSAGLQRPALVLLTRHEEAIAPGARMRSLGSRSTGIRRETRLFLIELDGALRVLLNLETDHRSEDGFGGYRVGGLTLRQKDGMTFLEGVRQDRLPASRARCREPEPYAVRFELGGSRFRELPVERPPVACG